MSDSLLQLIRSAAAGDQRAFAALHARYKKWVHAILLARLPPSDAEDQVQEVFLVAWKKLSTLDRSAGFGAWLGAIARNRAIECYRRRRPTEPLRDAWPDPRNTSSADLADARRALDAIQSLPEAYRETLVMR